MNGSNMRGNFVSCWLRPSISLPERDVIGLAQDWQLRLFDRLKSPSIKTLRKGSHMKLICSMNRGLPVGVLLLLSCLYDGLISTALQAQPLLRQADLVYQGAFRLPPGQVGQSSFAYGGSALAYNAANNS